MTTLLLRNPPTQKQLSDLLGEFPQCEVHRGWEGTIRDEVWDKIEIIYTDHLSREELELARQLQWIHSPQPYITGISKNELRRRERLLYTHTQEQNTYQIGEYTLGGLLGFAKNLFHWSSAEGEQQPLAPTWTLPGRIFVQLVLGPAGTEITRRMRAEGMRVWGLMPERSFHPYCERTFSMDQLHLVLPTADVVCLSFTRGAGTSVHLGSEEVALLKQGSLVILLGADQLVDQRALADRVCSGELRGVLADGVAKDSPLQGLSRVVITPGVATHPESTDPIGFQTFHFNLRQFLHRHHHAMKNIIDLEAEQCD